MVGQQRKQAGVRRFDRVEGGSVPRTAHHDQVGIESCGKCSLFLERGEIVFGGSSGSPCPRTR
jgi:hypothetical protein